LKILVHESAPDSMEAALAIGEIYLEINQPEKGIAVLNTHIKKLGKYPIILFSTHIVYK
jgi:hypothetical protein